MRRALVVLPLLAVLAACSGNDDSSAPSAGGSASGPEPSPSFSLSMVPIPPKPPPTGKLLADIEQSSRDGAANRFEVWVDNDTDATIRPTRITYDDQRFQGGLPGTRLRAIPSQSRRGYPIYIPDQPACGASATSGTVTVTYKVHGEVRTDTVTVGDEADVINRVASARCLELSIDQVAHLSWADEITASGDGGKDSVATMTLVIDTTGKPGPTLVIDSITGNPVLSPGDHGVANPNLTITGDQQPQRVPVELKPTRCDAHAFADSGSFAAFYLNVHIDGKPGQFVLTMGQQAAANALNYAKASCGFLTTVTGGSG